MADPYDLERFVEAQDAGGTYGRALAELGRGRKTSHWMWFVFPQIAGLGRSSLAQRYAIRSLAEARAYLAHPVLGARLHACAEAVAASSVPDADTLFGGIDTLKLQSSMTLFALAAPDDPVFGRVLARYFAGRTDPATHDLVRASG